MQQINARAVFLCSQACLPHLRRSANAHILNLSPPISLDPKWLSGHVAYTISKYGMTLCTLGMAAELAADGIAVNSLWPAHDHRHRGHRDADRRRRPQASLGNRRSWPRPLIRSSRPPIGD